eukprot:CAMPEP_0115885790 /NCGR_PEP_ID=MMETSP0287-20121206/30862_1 /TAXON_ID=412157 /ORGANISM="Chrysochromulina rotalis, Strain UIO044" /LENGTH=256 /DNA_ID=CAMNT_0003342231 /DNA_START=117 /DNA_END=887 /DNA_ORIENTATION=+
MGCASPAEGVGGRLTTADAAQVLCVASLLQASRSDQASTLAEAYQYGGIRNSSSSSSTTNSSSIDRHVSTVTRAPVHIEITTAKTTTLLAECALSAALSQLALALPCCPPGSRVILRLGDGSLKQRRLISQMIDSLARALKCATGLRLLAVHAPCAPPCTGEGTIRDEDGERLIDAAHRGWRARVHPLLVAARTGSSNPLAKLTPDLMRAIIELVEHGGRTRVTVQTAVDSTARAPPPARRTFAGDDLAHLAAMIS